MLYDAQGKVITDSAKAPADGRLVRFEQSDRFDSDVSRGLTPSLVDRILRSANSGDIQDQSRLALEIEEKNWDIAQALQTRRLAVAGLEWEALPGDDSPQAETIAADVEEVLRTAPWEQQDEDIVSFDQAIVYELMSALLPGFAMVEILWGKGGKTLDGYVGIPQQNFTFLDSRKPLLITTDNPRGIELPRSKFIYHRYLARSGDATRGGLIRPLAWLHCFQTLAGVKDLLRFCERYGMPFLVAKVNQQAWEQDRNRLKYLIQNFGSDGGAVFTDAVTVELLQAANNQGDVYFKLLEYFGAAITKVIQGQTATSGDAAGLSKGQAQENVRRDLVVADAQGIDATITARLIRNWVQYNYGPNAPVPRMHHKVEEKEDLKAASEVLKNLNDAGFDADEAEVSERFGFKLTRKAPPPPPPAPVMIPDAGGGVRPPPAPPAGAKGTDSPAAGGEAPPAPEDGAADSAALSAAETGSVGPLAKRSGETPSGVSPDSIADSALTGFLAGKGLADWFGPLQVALSAALRGEPDEVEFKRRLQALVSNLPELLQQMDSTEFEDVMSRTIYTAAAGGMAARAAKLS